MLGENISVNEKNNGTQISEKASRMPKPSAY